MSPDMYLDELLSRYQANFDITRNYKLGSRIYPAYAYFYSFGEKYVLKKEAQLWAIKAYEHVLFEHMEYFSISHLEQIRNVIENHMEPQLVRNNEKYPEKDHMCSYLTFVMTVNTDPSPETIKAIKKFKFDKGYMFNFRGHSAARLAVVSLSTGHVYSNYCGRMLKDLLEDTYTKCSSASNKKVS